MIYCGYITIRSIVKLDRYVNQNVYFIVIRSYQAPKGNDNTSLRAFGNYFISYLMSYTVLLSKTRNKKVLIFFLPSQKRISHQVNAKNNKSYITKDLRQNRNPFIGFEQKRQHDVKTNFSYQLGNRNFSISLHCHFLNHFLYLYMKPIVIIQGCSAGLQQLHFQSF